MKFAIGGEARLPSAFALFPPYPHESGRSCVGKFGSIGHVLRAGSEAEVGSAVVEGIAIDVIGVEGDVLACYGVVQVNAISAAVYHDAAESVRLVGWLGDGPMIIGEEMGIFIIDYDLVVFAGEDHGFGCPVPCAGWGKVGF